MRSLALIIAVAVGSTSLLSEPQGLSFEVATIKASNSYDARIAFRTQPGGRLSTTNTPLRMLIGYAFDANNRVLGGPNWLNSATFDLEAKADGAMPFPTGPEGEAKMRLLLQSLLAERFKLSVHWEAKEDQLYELVIAKGGAKLKETNANDKPPRMQVAQGHFIGTAEPVSLLARNLSQRLGRTVIDKTGLTGKYDFELTYTPEPGQSGVGVQPLRPDATADPNVPSIFTALEEQLGLKLESASGLVEVLVVDHVERPSEN
jgi:uncharacterized protein (TIGR03435 family)